MNFINNILQPRRRFLDRSVLFLLGMLLLSQPILAKEWEFDLPITEVSKSSSERQFQSSFIQVSKGDKVIVHIKNNSPFNYAIRWHGIHQTDNGPNEALSGTAKRLLSVHKNIKAGKGFTYRWKAKKAGTFWYHYHFNTS
ncbi:multicopper oxidase domain-containing protein [Nitrosococcus wardiae]|uniref:Copper oxidase n=1 Tax=Nitrosococcus wardiae TaxID=1814290 RepID=A0A4P7C5J9_9GAMM|nr:multicopper oxidase domain-containing protein [Nitrosococcus wardiae]QBQ56286.1 copper oxidase [Nitrosococcus wardiae]